MEKIEDFDDNELIRIVDSERYPNNTINFKNNFSLSYVETYEIVTGKERERFIKRSIENTQWHWEDTIPDELDVLLKINDRIQKSTKFIDTEKIIKEWLNVDDNEKRLYELIETMRYNRT